MCEELRVGPCNWSDAKHDAGGARTPSASPVFGEHLAQLRTVCLGMYIAEGAAGQSLAVMGSEGIPLNQPARKRTRTRRQACSLTLGSSYKSTTKWSAAQRKSEGIVVPPAKATKAR